MANPDKVGTVFGVFDNVAAMMPSLTLAASTISFALGAALSIGALRMAGRLANASGYRERPDARSAAVTMFFCGMVLMSLPFFMPGVANALWGQDVSSSPEKIFEIAPSTVGLLKGDAVASRGILAIVRIIQAIGFIAFIRGVLYLSGRSRGEIQGTAGPGYVRIVAGSAAINFPLVVGGIESLFG